MLGPIRKSLAVALVASLATVPVSVAPAGAAARAVASPAPVTIAQGTVTGIADNGTSAYRGIPFATAERWKAPRPAPGWTGVRDGSTYGPPCAQRITWMAEQDAPTTEDCLSINVTRPDGGTDGPRPVLLWIYGGGFVTGRGDAYDPTRLAKASGAIVVTFNYRLGVFGFFALPGTRADDPRVDFGLLDQQAALRWVRDNIAAFGGDPSRVTIFGESAGGISVCLHMISPQSAGLFSTAIAQSGTCDSLVQPSTAKLEAASLGLAHQLGCPDGPQQPACMRAKPVPDLSRLTMWDVNVIHTEEPTPWLPAVDGVTIPAMPTDLIDQGKVQRVPFVSGNTRDEGRLMVAGLYHWRFFRWVTQEDLTKLLTIEAHGDPVRLARLSAAYTATNYWTRDLAYAAVITDGSMACPQLNDREHMSAQGIPTWGYEFNGQVPFGDIIDGWWGMPVGSFHGTDVAYLFQQQLSPLPSWPLSPSQQALADTMGRYWGNVAAHGNPATPAAPPWPRFTPGGNVLNLQPGAIAPLPGGELSARHHCDIWNA